MAIQGVAQTKVRPEGPEKFFETGTTCAPILGSGWPPPDLPPKSFTSRTLRQPEAYLFNIWGYQLQLALDRDNLKEKIGLGSTR